MSRREISMSNLIGVGIYSLSEASRLSAVPASSLRRWMQGYSYQVNKKRIHQAPVITRDRNASDDDVVTLTFQDLIEARFVQAFRKIGVSWKVIRLAAEKARDRYRSAHPFTTEQFVSDGRSIFEQLRADGVRERKVVDMVTDQYCFRDVMLPSFRAQIDLTKDGAERWWPLGRKKKIVIDPARQFGRPIIADASIPTSVLAEAVATFGSEQLVSRWFEVPITSVRQAVVYEHQLHA